MEYLKLICCLLGRQPSIELFVFNDCRKSYDQVKYQFFILDESGNNTSSIRTDSDPKIRQDIWKKNKLAANTICVDLILCSLAKKEKKKNTYKVQWCMKSYEGFW